MCPVLFKTLMIWLTYCVFRNNFILLGYEKKYIFIELNETKLSPNALSIQD